MIDTHCHLDDIRFENERENIINSFQNDNIQFVINNSSDRPSVETTMSLATKYPRIFAAIGCHPQRANSYDFEFEKRIIECAQNPKVVAIGEIGLDYFYEYSDRETQKKVFKRQLCLANELHKPFVLHIRDAYSDAYEILKENKTLINYGGELHCYSGSPEMAKRFNEFGLYFAFGGTITYKNAKKDEIIHNIPKNRILSETDCPYLSPTPFRGQTNYPKYVRCVIDKLSEILEMSFDQTEQLIAKNTETLFKIST
ncbi:MAG: TatD family hydrolase [Clostridia bacterium]